MAADPRQFTEHNEVAGGNIYYEDKRMEELKGATGKTASQISTTDEFIPLQDTDGNLVKINPASFQEAVRNVLGSLLANNDKGTTISGIPALSGSGASLDFGSVTPANLASVLGVINFVNTVTTTDTYDNLANGFYSVYNAQQPSDGPYIGNGVIFSFQKGLRGFQLIFRGNSPACVYYRIKNSTGWTEWEQFAVTTTT